ncbi:MAG: helix-turn-helix domain-containing protein [Actinomycetota bacterium]|nr:helix-turn-helix domain-containing protein [Actinomycetota bacterium]
MPTEVTHERRLDEATKLSRARSLASSGAARTIRLANHLSLAEMARAAGIGSPVTVMRWERGERSPRGEAAIRYCELLDRLMRPGGSR